MARIRTIKPSFFKNEELAELPMSARMLFIGLWTLSDKDGRLEDRPKRIKVELFPYDSLEVDQLLSRLQNAGFIVRYEVGELKVIQIINFSKHQRITGTEATSESEWPEYQLIEGQETTWKQLGNNLDDRKGKDIGKGYIGKDDRKGDCDFNFFWDLYDKKKGDLEKVKKKWVALSDAERMKALEHIPKYKIEQPDKTYRKNPETYLNNKSFNDEIIFNAKHEIHSGVASAGGYTGL